MFTCVTDTGVLAWEIDGNNHVFLPGVSENTPLLGNTMIVVNLTRLIGNITASTATATIAHINFNGSVMFCSDYIGLDSGSQENKTIQVSGMCLSLNTIIRNFD